jgi:hypothetical protein
LAHGVDLSDHELFSKEEHVSKEQTEAACEPVGYVVFLVGDSRQPQPYSHNLLFGYSYPLKINTHLTSQKSNILKFDYVYRQ